MVINKLLDQRFGRETVMGCVEALDDWRRTWRDGGNPFPKRKDPDDGEVIAGAASLGPTGGVDYGKSRIWRWRCACGSVFDRPLSYMRQADRGGWNSTCSDCRTQKRADTMREVNRRMALKSNYWKHRLERQGSEEQ